MYEVKEQKLDFLIEKLVKQMDVIRNNVSVKLSPSTFFINTPPI